MNTQHHYKYSNNNNYNINYNAQPQVPTEYVQPASEHILKRNNKSKKAPTQGVILDSSDSNDLAAQREYAQQV